MAKHPDIIEVLRTIPIFLDLKPFQLARLATAMSIIDLEPNYQLITEGDPLDYTYILLEGDMAVHSFVPSIGNIETSHLGTFDVCGWSALTPVVRQRTGSVISVGYCRLLKMDTRILIPICEEDHDIGFCIYKRISNVAARTFLSTRIQLMNLIVKESQITANDVKP
jgi:CRP/FNR family transcriptional regulator, cyclic AMP receptor protein